MKNSSQSSSNVPVEDPVSSKNLKTLDSRLARQAAWRVKVSGMTAWTTVGILCVTLVLLTSVNGWSATYTAASCSQSDVNAVINGPTHSAVDGDTVIIPTGNCTWTSGITVPSGKGISIIGTGTPNATPATTGASNSCTQTNITVSGVTAFRFQPTVGNSTSRLSCIAFNYGSGAAFPVAAQGTCAAAGCPNIRWDNLTFSGWAGHSNGFNSYGINGASNVFGVLDHNTVNGSAGQYLHFVEFGLPSFKGIGDYGDNDYAEPENFGSADFLFIENNQFNTAGASENETNLVKNGGGRLVARFNTFSNMDGINFLIGWHGTESSGRSRSVHAFEAYGNTAVCAAGNMCWQVVGSRNGTGLVWGNTYTFSGANLHSLVGFGLYRAEANVGGWGACDGSSPWDTNDGTTYWTGTISSSVSGPGWGQYTITVSGADPGWTNNVWSPSGAPYSIHDTATDNGSEIQANGSNTLTTLATGSQNNYIPIVGHTIQIERATVCLDQAGRGAGRLYSGSPASPAAPSNQALTPVYVWSNTMSGSTMDGDIASSSLRVIRNRDYFVENHNQSVQTSAASPFDGTKAIGLGHGTLANRPTSCTPGVAYWATDQGSWNQSGSGSQGQLYTCSAPNTWTLYYTPYTYPHPLVSGGLSSPPDTTPPTLTNGQPTGTLASGTTSTTLRVTTNENSTCKYGTTANQSYASLPNTFSTTGGTGHQSLVNGLTDGSSYIYIVRCQDTAGNATTSDFSISFSVSQPSVGDTAPPVFSNIAATNITSTQATLTWTTDEASDSQVEWGPTLSYGSSSVLDSSLVTSHSVTPTGLSGGTTYHYRVKSRDNAGNLATSTDQTFTTSSRTNNGGSNGGEVQFLPFKNVFTPAQGNMVIHLTRGGTDIGLTIYDRSGNKVRSLNTITADPIWDGQNESGSIVASGTYICVLKQGDKVTKKKLVVVK